LYIHLSSRACLGSIRWPSTSYPTDRYRRFIYRPAFFCPTAKRPPREQRDIIVDLFIISRILKQSTSSLTGRYRHNRRPQSIYSFCQTAKGPPGEQGHIIVYLFIISRMLRQRTAAFDTLSDRQIQAGRKCPIYS